MLNVIWSLPRTIWMLENFQKGLESNVIHSERVGKNGYAIYSVLFNNNNKLAVFLLYQVKLHRFKDNREYKYCLINL